MLKRVVRRALGSRGDRAKPAPSQPAPAPRPAPAAPPQAADPPANPLSGIAARIAAGSASDPSSRVKATSGAAPTVTGAIQHDADGNAYWGSFHNESAHAKADGQTLVIDQWECIACGTCVENTDVVFVLPDDAKATVVRQEGDMELIQDAIDACPVTCIHWSDEPEQFDQLNDRQGRPIESSGS